MTDRAARRWRWATCLAASLAFASRAHADEPAAADMFGLDPTATPTPLDCRTGEAFGCAIATDDLALDLSPLTLSTWLPADEQRRLPGAESTQDGFVADTLGAGRGAGGTSLGGASVLENRWFVDGAPVESARTGGLDTRLPLRLLVGLRVTTGGFLARDRASTGGAVEAMLPTAGAAHLVRAWTFATVATARRTAPPLAGYFAAFTAVPDDDRRLTAGALASGPGPHLFGGASWYVLGGQVAARDDGFTRAAQRQVEASTREPYASSSAGAVALSVPVVARLGWHGGHHDVALSLVGTYASEPRFTAQASLPAGAVDHAAWVGDGIARWTGSWATTTARVIAAWHRADRAERARNEAYADRPQLQTAYIPLHVDEDPLVAAACTDGPAAVVVACPIPLGYYASHGAGLLTSTVGDTPSLTADIAHRLGHHVARVGVTGEDARLVVEQHFTGGELQRSLFPGHLDTTRFVAPGVRCAADPHADCATVDAGSSRYRTRYLAAYVEDTWRATPDVVLDAGLRWERQQLGDALDFSAELAPRIGLAWDPLGGGRSRVSLGWSRSYPLLPAGMGQVVLGAPSTVHDIQFGEFSGRAVEDHAPLAIAGGIQPERVDEATAAVEVAALGWARMKLWGQARWLRDGIEWTGRAFGNPGGDPAIDDGELATRHTTMVGAELRTQHDGGTLGLRLGYTYGRAIGTFAGPYDALTGATFYGSATLAVASSNLTGALPTDLGHRAYGEVSTTRHLGGVPLAVGARFEWQSGAPRDITAGTVAAIVQLIGRGDGGRLAPVTSLSTRVSAHLAGLDVFADVLGIFDRQTAITVDSLYTDQAVRPIAGGTAADLPFARTTGGQVLQRSPRSGRPTEFAPPLTASLGIAADF